MAKNFLKKDIKKPAKKMKVCLLFENTFKNVNGQNKLSWKINFSKKDITNLAKKLKICLLFEKAIKIFDRL